MQKFIALIVQTIGVYVGLMTFLFISASATASMLGCRLDEGSAHSCMLFTRDIGGQLYGEGLSFLYIFMGLPLWGLLIFAGGSYWSSRAYKKDPSPMTRATSRTIAAIGGLFAGAIFLVPLLNLAGTPSIAIWWSHAQAYIVFNTLPLIIGIWWLVRGLREGRKA